MGWDGRADANLDKMIAYFKAHSMLTASPTTHSLGANASLVERPLAKGASYTAVGVWKQLRAAGVKVLPTIYNDAGGEPEPGGLFPKVRNTPSWPRSWANSRLL
jgi:hypothetical protein